MNSSLVKNIYDNYASIYDLVFSVVLNPARKKAIRQMNIQPNEKIIEFGVGTGLSFNHYNFSNKISITGIDLSEKMLEKARSKVAKYKNFDITLSCIDAEDTPYDDSTYDKVMLMYVYSVTPNPEKLLSEAFRICKENGSVHIVNHFSNYENSRLNLFERSLSKMSKVIGFRTVFSYQDYIKNLNLNIESVESANIFSSTKVIHLKKKDNGHLYDK